MTLKVLTQAEVQRYMTACAYAGPASEQVKKMEDTLQRHHILAAWCRKQMQEGMTRHYVEIVNTALLEISCGPEVAKEEPNYGNWTSPYQAG